jgi:hypothetical protein
MLWQVEGASKKTGDALTRVVTANSENEARESPDIIDAMYVSNCTPVSEAPAVPTTTNIPPYSELARAAKMSNVIGVISMVLGIFAVIGGIVLPVPIIGPRKPVVFVSWARF